MPSFFLLQFSPPPPQDWVESSPSLVHAQGRPSSLLSNQVHSWSGDWQGLKTAHYTLFLRSSVFWPYSRIVTPYLFKRFLSTTASPAPLPGASKGWWEVTTVLKVDNWPCLCHHHFLEVGLMESPSQPPFCSDAKSGFSRLTVHSQPCLPMSGRTTARGRTEPRWEGDPPTLRKGGSLPNRAPLEAQVNGATCLLLSLALAFKSFSISFPWFQISAISLVICPVGEFAEPFWPQFPNPQVAQRSTL